MEELRRKFQQRFGESGDQVFQGTVTEVNEDEFTCTVKRDDQVDYFDVRLRGLVNADLQGFASSPGWIVRCWSPDREKQRTVRVPIHRDRQDDIYRYRFGNNHRHRKYRPQERRKDNRPCRRGKLEVTNDKVKALHEADALTVTADSTTVKASTGGVTITRSGSGLKKTLDDMLTAIQALTVTTPHGPSSTPINSAKFASIQADLPNYLEG